MKQTFRKWTMAVAMAFIFCLAGLSMNGTAFGAGGQQCVDNEDGTITDKNSGLMWQKATAGPMNWRRAMTFASGLSLGGHSDWRLPTMNELMGLYNSPCKNVMEVHNFCYWSSSRNEGNSSKGWSVDFYGGYEKSYGFSYCKRVRAVRDEQ